MPIRFNKSFTALYNDGKSALESESEVTIIGDQLNIKNKELDQTWDLRNCSVEAFGPDQGLILYHNQKLKVSKKIYSEIKKTYFKHDWANALMLKTLLGLVIVISLIYLNQEMILNHIKKMIPDSAIAKQGAEIKKFLKNQSCINTAKKEQLISKLKSLLSIEDDIEVFIASFKDVNAIALPGKTIIFFNGLIQQIDHEDEVVGILAHELGHIKLKHHRTGMAKIILFNFVWRIAARDNESLNFFKHLMSGAYTQAEEKEADLFARELMIKSNISLKGAREFMLRQKKKEGFLSNLSTSHPEYDQRIETFTLGEPIKRKKLLTDDELKLLKNICSK